MASYTEHLELLKKDPVADGADTFNIQTMLNDNWEKIDAAVAGKADVGEDGKIPASQLPEMNYDPAGSAAAVQVNLAAHMADKNNPHGLDAGDVGARPNTWVPDWGDVTGKPSTFPPSGHTHDTSQIVSGILPASRGGTGVGSIAELASLLAGQGMCRIGFGYYLGTGTYGASNPVTVNFEFPAKFFWIYAGGQSAYNYEQYAFCSGYTGNYFLNLVNVEALQTTYTRMSGPNSGRDANHYTKRSSDYKSISWYSETEAEAQFNESDTTWYYVYFG